MGKVLDYNLQYHVIQEEEDDSYIPKLSFTTFEEAKEFVQFAPNPNLIIATTKELKNYYLGLEYRGFDSRKF